VNEITVDLNATIGPILTSVTDLFPTILDLVLAVIPVIIAMSVIGFVLGIFEGVLSKIKM